MSQKKIINPIEMREYLQITYPIKSVRSAGLCVFFRYLHSYSRDKTGMRLRWKNQGFRLCLKRK